MPGVVIVIVLVVSLLGNHKKVEPATESTLKLVEPKSGHSKLDEVMVAFGVES